MASLAAGDKTKRSAPAKVHHLTKVIAAHCFNWDRSQLAVCPNSEEIHIYAGCHQPNCKDWLLYEDESKGGGGGGAGGNGATSSSGAAAGDGRPYYVLKQRSSGDGHTLVVNSIDWHPHTNKIVTCSQDRNAFVWVYNAETDTWESQPTELGFTRGATMVRWSPDGKKFAVAGAARLECVNGKVHKTQGHLAVCCYEAHNKWWISKSFKKKLKKTVLSLAWHPSGQILAAGFADCVCRIYGAFLKDIDERVPTIFGDNIKFGELLAQFDNAVGWVESIAWSPSGWRLAFASHDASVTMVQFFEDAEADPPLFQQIKSETLPFTVLEFLTEEKIVAAGHELNPHLYSADGDGIWALETTLDNSGEDSDSAATKKNRSSQFGKAMTMWGGAKLRSNSGGSGIKKAIKYRHDRPIVELRPYAPTIGEVGKGSSGDKITKFSTVGVDGKLVIWDVSAFV